MSHPPTERLGNSPNFSSYAQRLTSESWIALSAYATAAIVLGYALEIHDASYDPREILCLSVAIVLTFTGLLFPLSSLEDRREAPLLVLILAGVAFQFWTLLRRTAELSVPMAAFLAALIIGAVIATLVARKTGFARRIMLPLFLVVFFCSGVVVIRQTPEPFIDVHLFHTYAIDSVLHGRDPHSGTIPNIYENDSFYGPGIVKNGQVQVGFPYPPLSLLFSLAGYLVAGDHRYSLLVAMTLTGALLAYARPGILAFFGALIFLTTPSIFHLLENGWSDPFVMVLLAATVFCACRARKLLPWTLGLLLAIKQYTILVLPLTLLLLPQPVERREFARLLIKAVVLAAAVTLPILIWNPHGFLNDVVYLQFRQPFRYDSLSYLAWLSNVFGIRLPAWLGFVLVIPTTALALWRAARTPGGFAAAVAAVYILFFAFSKQAFANYYIVVIAALCCAIAARVPVGSAFPVSANRGVPGVVN